MAQPSIFFGCCRPKLLTSCPQVSPQGILVLWGIHTAIHQKTLYLLDIINII